MATVCKLCKGKGKVFDYTRNHFVDCPECTKKRIMDISVGNNESLNFGLECPDLKPDFSYNAMIQNEWFRYTADSQSKQKKEITDCIESLQAKKLPKYSICFGIGDNSRPDILAYSMASAGYIAGLSVAPVITCRKLFEFSLAQRKEVNTYLESDVVILIVPTNPTRASLLHCVGIMQERAMNNKPTFFITTYEESKCEYILTPSESKKNSLWKAKRVFLKAKEHHNLSEEIFMDNLTDQESDCIEVE